MVNPQGQHSKPRPGIKIIHGLKLRRDIMKPRSTPGSDKRTGPEGLIPDSDQGTQSEKGLVITPNPVLLQEPLESINVEKPSKWIQFGPTYGEQDTEVNQRAKESAWKHILNKSDGNETKYLGSIAEIEKKAMECYEAGIAEGLKRAPHDFRWTMVKDGCFFLQLALHILGGWNLLGYPQQHPYFGEKSQSSSWIPAMFFVGNQIPCQVINALMKQTFFQDVIRRGKWQRPHEDDMIKIVLYETVIEPQLTAIGTSAQPPEPPSNILQALHTLLMGSGDDDPIFSEMRNFQDLEGGGEDSGAKIPSAGELYKLGIKLRKAERGINNIRFKNRGYAAYLYVPPFTINGHTEHLLTSLVKVEQSLSESDRELTAYLRFMRDLAPTYKDFKILHKRKIIQVEDEELKGRMVHMLDSLVSQHSSNFTLNFRQIRRRITDYGGPPWRLISFALGALTVVQTIFTILSYFIPRS